MYHDENSNSGVEIRKKLFILIFVLIVMAAVVVSGVEQGITEAGANEGIGTADANMGGGQADVSRDKAIQSITFKKDIGIRDALRFLAAKYQKNIVPSAKVDGFVTVTNLYDVTFEQALSAILGNNFKYDQEGNFIKVYTVEEYAKVKEDKDRMVHKVFTLYYISAAEAKKLIAPVLSKSGLIETTTAAQTGVPTAESISADTKAGDTTAMNDTIIVYDYPENVAEAERVMASVDIKPRQVLIEATILSATLTEDMQVGIDWKTLQDAVTGLSGITQNASDYFTSAGNSQITKTGGLSIGLAHDNVAAFIRAVEEITDVTILANPKILAINKQLGQVYIGKKIGYKSITVQNDNTTTEQVTFLDTGTKLSFRPYIGDDGYIRMDIHSKDSSGAFNAQGVPDETSAELVSNIMVKDGQTIVIGGLFRDKITTKKTQVPVLGDIPILGMLFRGTADTNERQEVMILLTPHIINEPEDTHGAARVADIGRKRNGAKNGIQWIGRARLAEDHYANAVRYYADNNSAGALSELDMALELRPTYLEAIRLKERIIEETNPQKAARMERVVLSDIDREMSDNWLRR